MSGMAGLVRRKGGMRVHWKTAPGFSAAKATLMRSHSSGLGTSEGSGRGGGRVGVGREERVRIWEGRPREEYVQALEVMMPLVVL